MCISLKASVNTFLLGVTSSLALVFFGNQNMLAYNIIVAGIFIFVSLMQLVDLGMWIDLDCSLGTNKLASILGPALNWFQPTAVFLIIYYVFRYTKSGKQLQSIRNNSMSNNSIINHFNIGNNKINFIKILNGIYAIIVVIMLGIFYNKGSKDPSIFCTKVLDGHLKWNWYEKFDSSTIMGVIWHITLLNLLSINLSNVFVLFTIGITYIFLFASMAYKSQVAEIWCYLVNFVPLIMLVLQKVFPSFMMRNIGSN